VIKIEVTGNSIAEVADKLLALGTSLQTTPLPMNPVMPEVRDAAPAPAKAKKAPAAKAAEPVVHTPDVVVTPPTAEEEPTPEPAVEVPAMDRLDFDKDITPLVLRVVAEKSRDAVIEILGQFGAARASEVPEAQWPELLNALTDAL
jgi:hypothetical protein